MRKNVGKIFEEQWKKSTPSYALLYRIPDSAQVFNHSNGLRFSPKCPFDFILWDSKKHILYALELKTVSGKSISFEKSKDDHGEIHFHQIVGLNEWNQYDGITCGIVIEFRQIEKTVFIPIDTFNALVNQVDKKSFNYDDVINCGLPYFIIRQSKKRTRYIYDVEGFLENVSL